MSRLNWGSVGERFYEAGVDRGVLYVSGESGVPWNGLVSVSEEPSGGEAKPYYLDGVKYLNRASNEEFAATIEAYTYPKEFAQCDGTKALKNGLFATQQRRKSFGLSYRSKIGNDVDGLDHGYKIHLVYNALVAPSTHEHTTFSESIEPDNFSWNITTRPSKLASSKPTAHFVIDSRETPEALLQRIEDILYGSFDGSPRLPVPDELYFYFNSYDSGILDAGAPTAPSYLTYDGGPPNGSTQTSTLDGGGV